MGEGMFTWALFCVDQAVFGGLVHDVAGFSNLKLSLLTTSLAWADNFCMLLVG